MFIVIRHDDGSQVELPVASKSLIRTMTVTHDDGTRAECKRNDAGYWQVDRLDDNKGDK